MESMHNSGSNGDMRTGPSTNSSEGEQYNKEKKQVPSSSSPFSSDFTSQDPSDFMPNAKTTTTTHPTPLGTNDQTYLQPELHNTHSAAEKGDERPINTHLEAHSANPFGEAFPSSLENNTAPSSSSPPNPFLVMSDDATNTTHSLPSTQQQKGGSGMTNNSLSTYPADGLFSSLAPSTYESSQENPFKASPSANSTRNTYLDSADLVKVDEHHDHGNESHHTLPSPEQQHWSMPSSEARTQQSNTHGETHVPSSSQQSDPLFTLESAQNQQADATSKNRTDAATIPTSFQPHHTFSDTEQVHHSKAGSNSGTDNKLGSSVSPFSPASESSTQDHMHHSSSPATKPPQKQEKDFNLGSEFNDDDLPISSFPKHGQQTSDNSAGQFSSVPLAPGTSNGPPLQVMERSEDPTTSSNYKFPSHVFDRHKSKSNTQWSTASNESLFSIQMGNMSFSSEMAWMNKSGDMDKTGDMNSSSAGTFQSNQPPLPLPPQPQPPSTKFNDISQSTAKQHQGSKVTEEKAAETMREVIMESSVHKENVISKGNLIPAGGATGSNRLSNSNAHSQSHHSDGSTKSFAFNVFTDVDKTPSSKHIEEKTKQQKMQEQQSLKATPDVAAAQNPKPTPNAPQKKSWLSCFSCC